MRAYPGSITFECFFFWTPFKSSSSISILLNYFCFANQLQPLFDLIFLGGQSFIFVVISAMMTAFTKEDAELKDVILKQSALINVEHNISLQFDVNISLIVSKSNTINSFQLKNFTAVIAWLFFLSLSLPSVFTQA